MTAAHPDADRWARRLAAGAPIAERLALVVAHPDDETLWAGATLARLADPVIVMVTDGAPEDMADARRLGFATRADYAAARARELEGALSALGVAARPVRYEVDDQAAVTRIGAIADRLERDCSGVAAILTHPYEGGHPDHDAVALAAALAGRRLGVPVVEFACYARFEGTRVFGRFARVPGCAEHVRALDGADRARVDRALAAHASQAAVFGTWRPAQERWRAAPAYDFSRPPPGEAVLFDEFGWTLTGDRWRDIAAPWAAPWAALGATRC